MDKLKHIDVKLIFHLHVVSKYRPGIGGPHPISLVRIGAGIGTPAT